jgi:hypothetical protein
MILYGIGRYVLWILRSVIGGKCGIFVENAAWTGRQGEGLNLVGSGHGVVWKRISKDFELKNGW